MASKAYIAFLVSMMLLTGVCNTLLTKYQDNQCLDKCDSPDPKQHVYFEQPVLQTAQMFVGEMGCWLVVGLMNLRRRFQKGTSTKPSQNGYQALRTEDDEGGNDVDNGTADDGASIAPSSIAEAGDGEGTSVLRGYRILLLALPSICDILGTTLMNAGLLLVAASIYQMTRGALVLFVGLFSVLFLHRRLRLVQWLSLVGVMAGVAVVGLAGAIWPDTAGEETLGKAAGKAASSAVTAAAVGTEALRVIIGVLLIAGAQIFTATQFVLEEWILERSPIAPLRVVGWEGLFGLAVTATGMLVLHLALGRSKPQGHFDMLYGLAQMRDRRILVSSLLIMVSIGGFNFFGLSVTRNVSATSRSTIDTCRTLFIWLVSLGLGWESFKWLQVVGFGLLVYFTFLFNGLVQAPFAFMRDDEPVESVGELLPEEPVEHM